MRCARRSSPRTGAKVPKPTCKVSGATAMSRAARAASRSGVKCRPAVGRGDRAGIARVHGLVALAIVGIGAGRPLDVGRQRHVAEAIEQRERRVARGRLELDQDRAVVAARATRCEPAPAGSPARSSSASSAPARSGLCERASATHAPSGRPASAGSSRSSSTAPPDGLRARSRAGMTLVSLTTRTAPAGSSPGRSAKPRSREPRRAGGVDEQQARGVAAIGRALRNALGR